MAPKRLQSILAMEIPMLKESLALSTGRNIVSQSLPKKQVDVESFLLNLNFISFFLMSLSKLRKMKIGSVLFPGTDSGGTSRYIASELDWKSRKMLLKLCEETVKQTGHKNIRSMRYQPGSAITFRYLHRNICRFQLSYTRRLPAQT